MAVDSLSDKVSREMSGDNSMDSDDVWGWAVGLIGFVIGDSIWGLGGMPIWRLFLGGVFVWGGITLFNETFLRNR